MKVKSLIQIVLLALVAFGGWWLYRKSPETDGSSVKGIPTPTSVPDSPSSAEKSGTAGQEIREELAVISKGLFTPLEEGHSAETAGALRELWSRAKAEFEAGNLGREEARILTSLIRELNVVREEREKFQIRFDHIDGNEAEEFAMKGPKAERNRKFMLTEVRRQWASWSASHRRSIETKLAEARTDG